MGTSKLVPTFLISDGARLRTILRWGRSMPTLRNVALMRSLDSLMAASGRPIISIIGSDLLLSTSTCISNHSKPMVANVLILDIDMV